MKKSFNLFLFFSFVFTFYTSCKKEPKGGNRSDHCMESEFEPSSIVISDDSLMRVAYSNFKYPDNFYRENLGDSNLYYVNTVSIDSLNGEKWFELSTNHSNQAESWSFKSSPQDAPFVNKTRNDKYYEFVGSRGIKFRTHNASYFTRNNVDLLNERDTIGAFRKPNFCGNDAKELIDYLWFVRNYNFFGSRVLVSDFENYSNEIVVHHFCLEVTSGDFGVPDKIFLYHKRYHVSKANGLIVKNEVLLKTISGKI